MTDFATDCDSAISLVVDEYQALQRLNPQHKLLSYATEVDSTGFTRTEGYEEKFVENSKEHSVRSHTRYYFALREAVTEELNKVIASERKKLKGSLEEVNSELEKIFTKQGLIGLIRVHITHNQRPIVLA